MSKFKNKNSLFLIISLLLITGFFVTNFISYYAAKKSLRDNIINTSLPLTRDNIYTEIQRDIMLPVYVASLMANDTFLKDWVIEGEPDIKPIIKYLNEIKTKYNFFTSFFVSENTKQYYYHDGVLKTISQNDDHDIWYYAFTGKHVPYELVVDTNEAQNNELTIFINHRVYDYDNNLIGVTGVGLDLERITNLLLAYRIKYNRDIYLVDKHGLIKAHHDKSLVEISNIRLMEGIDSIADDILKVGQQSVDFEFNRGNEHFLLTKRYIPELSWFLIVEQNQNKAIENIWLNFIKSTLIGLLISGIVLFIIITAVNYYNKRLEKLAVTDELTGSFNRREFKHMFDKAVAWNRKNESVFSVMLIDIDNFKQINDNMGHLTGDEVIKAVTDTCNSSVRDNDLIARWGGDEFILLIFGDKSSAVSIAERIMQGLKTNKIISELNEKGLNTTLSIGITEYTPSDTQETITARADRALFAAKEGGRNRFVTEIL